VYASYIPHSFIFSVGDEGFTHPYQTSVTLPQNLDKNLDKALGEELLRGVGGASLGVFHRMVKKSSSKLFRVLPLHLAMEGFLSLYFKGPQIAFDEYVSTRAHLSPRTEHSTSGRSIQLLDEALRTFELYEGQVGLALFVAESLTSLFVVSHPDDYKALHRSLIEDFYAEQLVYHAQYTQAVAFNPTINPHKVTSLQELSAALDGLYDEWSAYQDLLLEPVLSLSLNTELINTFGPYQLQRFHSTLTPQSDNLIGEAIVSNTGRIEYLKTYRLSHAQTKRAYLLKTLAEHEWDLDRVAEAFNQSKAQLLVRLDSAGFGYLIKPHILRAARAGQLTSSR
jgi:hypothetical protein